MRNLIIDSMFLSEESYISVRFKHFIKTIWRKILYPILKFILNLFIVYPFKIVKIVLVNLYEMLENKLNKLKKILFISIVGSIGITFIVLMIINNIKHHFYYKYLLNVGIVDVSLIVVYFLLILFHKYYLEDDIYARKEQQTRTFIKNYVDRIGKIYGETGAGKDELAAAFSSILSEKFKEDIDDLMEEIKNVAYIFDYDLIEKIADMYPESFFSSSEKETKKHFFSFFLANNGFLKPYYRKKIDLNTFIQDSKNLKENKLSYYSEYIYRTSDISKKHFLDMAYDYLMLYIRINVEKNILWTNQPFVESFEDNLTAKIFSLDYLITKHQKDETITDPTTGSKNLYEEKILYPFKDFNIFLETECGSWYINLDNAGKRILLEYGVRDFKAFNRHFMPHFAYYAVDQDAERMFKVLKELDHSHFRVDYREEVNCGKRENLFITYRLKKVEKKLEKEFMKLAVLNGKGDKYLERIEYMKKLYYVSSNSKFKDKQNYYERLLEEFPSIKAEILLKKKKELTEQIKYNEYVNGYIVKDITISKYPIDGELDVVEVGKKLQEFKNKKGGRRKSYCVRFYFKKSDCWRYDTHYMKSGKNYRSDNSELNMMEAPNWESDLIMKKENIKTMDYGVANAMFGISKEEALLTRYKLKNNENE